MSGLVTITMTAEEFYRTGGALPVSERLREVETIKISKEIINPLATVELIAPLVQLLIEYEDRPDELHDTICTLHQLLFPSTWRPPSTNADAVATAINFVKVEAL